MFPQQPSTQVLEHMTHSSCGSRWKRAVTWANNFDFTRTTAAVTKVLKEWRYQSCFVSQIWNDSEQNPCSFNRFEASFLPDGGSIKSTQYAVPALYLEASELKNQTEASHENNELSYAKEQHFLFQSCQPSSPWSLFLTWPHTHYFFLPLLILVFWTFFFSLFCVLAWGGVGILESSWISEEPCKGGTQRADVLFHHTRSLCGCQLAVGALGMVCMCWASGVARHTSGKGLGSQWRAWNSKVKQSDTVFMKGKLPLTFLLCGLSMSMDYECVDFVSLSYR